MLRENIKRQMTAYQVSIFHPSGMPCTPVTSQVAFSLLMNVPEAATPLSQSFVVFSDGSVGVST